MTDRVTYEQDHMQAASSSKLFTNFNNCLIEL